MVDARPPAVVAPGIVHFDSVGAGRTQDVLNRFYPQLALVSPEGAELKVGIEVIHLGPVTVGHLTFSGHATLLAPAAVGYHVTLPTAGRMWARHGGQELVATPGTALAFRPGDPVWLRHEPDSAEIDVRIEPAALESELAALLGHPIEGPIDLPMSFGLTVGPAHSWSRLIRLLQEEGEHATSLIHQPVIAGQLCSSVLSGLLLSVPHRYRDELTAPAGSGPPRPIRRAVEAVEMDPERGFTVGELAGIAGISVRSLQEGFRRHVGCAPMAYLQQVRLDRTRDALRQADPARTTVAAVAYRCGFTHLGRFASAYRDRFGESPSETLRRTGPA